MMIKTVDELITHLREEKNINVSNNDKQSLINIGYYHGYKGYRFIKNVSNQIDITKFDEILLVQTSIYNQVIYTDINQKLQNINNFINS